MSPRVRQAHPDRRGAALMLSFLVLIVILMICYQIARTTGLDRNEAQRTRTLTAMDYAISSAFMQVEEDLLADVAESGEEEAAGGAAVDPSLMGGGDEKDPAEGGGTGASDSQMDAWATPQVTQIGGEDLRIFVVDEDRKFNLLNMLAEDEEEAEEALEIVTRILDNCREGTLADLDRSEASEMARAMRDHMTRRNDSVLPRPQQLSSGDGDEESQREADPDAPAMPLTMREFVVLEPFQEQHFRDFFDQDGERVHSIDQFLTIYTSPATYSSPDAESGYEVNLNTAPLAVLNGLFDSREVDTRLWDEVLAYRNEAEEVDEDEEDYQPTYDEFGNEVPPRKFFDDLDELAELRSWDNIEAEEQAPILERLVTTSNVFSIYVVARKPLANEENQILQFQSLREREEYERTGLHLVRVVRRVVWRRGGGDGGSSMTPLVPWEVLDHAPLQVLDYPEDL
jgi:hypothetical protein